MPSPGSLPPSAFAAGRPDMHACWRRAHPADGAVRGEPRALQLVRQAVFQAEEEAEEEEAEEHTEGEKAETLLLTTEPSVPRSTILRLKMSAILKNWVFWGDPFGLILR